MMNTKHIQNIIKTALLTLMSLPLIGNAQQICNTKNIKATTPNSRFEILSNGSEVKDKKTGLIWQRCSLGQQWNGTTCIGDAKEYIWQEALKQAKTLGHGYRLPNVKELASITETQCDNLTINSEIFPETQASDYWTSTPLYWPDFNTTGVFTVSFYAGTDFTKSKNAKAFVRVVRSE